MTYPPPPTPHPTTLSAPKRKKHPLFRAAQKGTLNMKDKKIKEYMYTFYLIFFIRNTHNVRVYVIVDGLVHWCDSGLLLPSRARQVFIVTVTPSFCFTFQGIEGKYILARALTERYAPKEFMIDQSLGKCLVCVLNTSVKLSVASLSQHAVHTQWHTCVGRVWVDFALATCRPPMLRTTTTKADWQTTTTKVGTLWSFLMYWTAI